MKTQCCQPPYGSMQCQDCPLTVPMYRPNYNLGLTAGGTPFEAADAAKQIRDGEEFDIHEVKR